MFAVVVTLLLLAVPCLAQTIVLNATTNCPDFPDGYNIHLPQGTYDIEYVSGAWSPIPSDEIYGGYAWSSRVHLYVYATAQSGVIGSPATPGLYQSPELAEAAAKGIYVLIIPRNTIVSFWLEETVNSFNDCSDNRGSVTLRFVSPLANEATTWGRIKSLYRMPIR
jgi:hypothetical protein